MSKLVSDNRSVFWKMILLLIMAGLAVFLVSPVSADTVTSLAGKGVVTIAAPGSQSYYMGEKVVFSGMNTDSDSTYLFITGPNLPDGGGKLSPPYQNPVSGDPGSFTMAKTKPDKTWEYTWYTSNLRLDAGSYTVYAVSTAGIKRPVQRFNNLWHGQYHLQKTLHNCRDLPGNQFQKDVPFTVSGVAEGIPRMSRSGSSVRTTTPSQLNLSTLMPRSSMKSPRRSPVHLASGQYFVIVQHPMQNNQFDIDVSGDYVRSLNLNNGTNLFQDLRPGKPAGQRCGRRTHHRNQRSGGTRCHVYQ